MNGPDAAAPLLLAINWVQALLLGSLATMIAGVAVAFAGMAMLSGRLDWRRGARVILGCAIIFGAGRIAQGLVSSDAGIGGGASAPVAALAPLEAPADAGDFDPYAGASPLRRAIGKDELARLLRGDAMNEADRQTLRRLYERLAPRLRARFPEAEGLVRIEARTDNRGRLVNVEASSRMLNPVATQAVAELIEAQGVRLTSRNQPIALPALMIGTPEQIY